MNHEKTIYWTLFVTALVIVQCLAAAKPGDPGGPGEYRDFKVIKSYFAKDGAHTFRAFVIEWEGQEVVAMDVGSLIKARTDETINVLVSRGIPTGTQIIAPIVFLARPEKKPPGGSVLAASNEMPSVVSLRVKKVYSLMASDYAFRAYEVEWMGQDVVVFDGGLASSYEEGDAAPVMVTKSTYENNGESRGLLHFRLLPSRAQRR